MKLARVALVLAVVTVAASAWVGGMPAQGADIAPANSRQALNQVVHELDVDGVSVGKVLDYLRNVSGANIVVNWKSLEAAGVD
ncbi:MAG TPA: hypothetical protein VGN88_01330, partial [Phycisphaerae bacterium]